MRTLVGIVLALCLTGTAWAEGRIALVVGNGAYQHHPQLLNTDDDARLMEATLAGLGFDVELMIDASRSEMEAGFLRLNQRLKAAGPDAVGLFYFAGHGVQSQGLNYLMPVDSTARVEPEVWSQAPRLGLLMDYLADAGNATNFIILDACRDNPLPAAGRTLGGGLASAGRTRGTLIAYATAPGYTAADGVGQANSPFTSALARLMPTAGWNAETLFKRVASDVESATMVAGAPAQSPWYENGLRGEDFCFAGCSASRGEDPTVVMTALVSWSSRQLINSEALARSAFLLADYSGVTPKENEDELREYVGYFLERFGNDLDKSESIVDDNLSVLDVSVLSSYMSAQNQVPSALQSVRSSLSAFASGASETLDGETLKRDALLVFWSYCDLDREIARSLASEAQCAVSFSEAEAYLTLKIGAD